MIKYIDRIWFTSRTTVGLVLIYDEFDGYKCYIGAGNPLKTEDEDTNDIINYGAKFPLDAAKVLFPHIDFNSKPEFSEEY